MNADRLRELFPRRDDLTPVQLEKIATLRSELREDLAAYPSYDTDFQLLRWLIGWEYDIGFVL